MSLRASVRRLVAPVAGFLLFAGFLAWLFPADVVVRRVLARATPPGGPTVVFARAALRPDGIHLEDVTLRAPTGAVLGRIDGVRLRPSLLGLVRDGSGLPWRLDAAVCGGHLSARVFPDGPATGIALTWEDADVAACPLLPIAAGALAGRAHGAARLRLAPAAWPEGDGRVDLEAGRWEGAGNLQALGALHAASASVRWTLRDGHLALEALDLHGPELTASGNGAVELADPLPDSTVQLTLALATAPDAHGAIRLLLGPPGTDRQLRVGGTLARPSALVR